MGCKNQRRFQKEISFYFFIMMEKNYFFCSLDFFFACIYSSQVFRGDRYDVLPFGFFYEIHRVHIVYGITDEYTAHNILFLLISCIFHKFYCVFLFLQCRTRRVFRRCMRGFHFLKNKVTLLREVLFNLCLLTKLL
jgi:hypothetical protein